MDTQTRCMIKLFTADNSLCASQLGSS